MRYSCLSYLELASILAFDINSFLVQSNIIFCTYSLHIEGAASSLTWVNSIKHS